jgi:hypothetical protein
MIPFQGGLVESLDYCSSQDSQIEASCYCFNKKNIDNKDKKKKKQDRKGDAKRFMFGNDI